MAGARRGGGLAALRNNVACTHRSSFVTLGGGYLASRVFMRSLHYKALELLADMGSLWLSCLSLVFCRAFQAHNFAPNYSFKGEKRQYYTLYLYIRYGVLCGSEWRN